MAFSGIHPSVILAAHKLVTAKKKLQTQVNWLTAEFLLAGYTFKNSINTIYFLKHHISDI
jgi:hypothetical protein